MVCVFYNPVAGTNDFSEQLEDIAKIFDTDEVGRYDVIATEDLMEIIDALSPEDKIVVCGGDGTLNNFINRVRLSDIGQDLYHYPAGSGNDFCNDIDFARTSKIYRINDYLKCLPVMRVRGKDRLFINGIGFGLDGYCCAEGNRLRAETPGMKVAYASIAVKAIMYAYKKVNATVVVDGVRMEFTDVWMASAMNGRFFGRRMMIAPNQDRMNDDGLLSVIIVHSKFRIPLIAAFASIYKGKHLKYKNLVSEVKGSDIIVEFDKPTALQIDGDTILDVLKYEVHKDKKS